MEKRHWQKIETILDGALNLQREAQAEWVKTQCGDDKELYEMVMLLLKAIQQAEDDGFLLT